MTAAIFRCNILIGCVSLFKSLVKVACIVDIKDRLPRTKPTLIFILVCKVKHHSFKLLITFRLVLARPAHRIRIEVQLLISIAHMTLKRAITAHVLHLEGRFCSVRKCFTPIQGDL